MNFWTVLICTVIALQSVVVRSETWSCSFKGLKTGKPAVIVLQRVEGGFTDPTHPFAPEPMIKILHENDNVIHLYEEILDEYYATRLNKLDKYFMQVGLRSIGPASFHAIEGSCEVY